MRHSHTITAAIASAALLAGPVLADTLPAGKPAGVKEAQINGLVAIGAGVLIVGAVAIAIASSSKAPATPVAPATST